MGVLAVRQRYVLHDRNCQMQYSLTVLIPVVQVVTWTGRYELHVQSVPYSMIRTVQYST